MGVETETERAIFFDCEEFAVACTYTRAGQTLSEPPLMGIFDNEFVSVSFEGGAELASTDPVFQVSTAKLHASAAPGDTLVIEGVTYKARVFQPDGTGVTTIVLERQ